MIKIPSVRVYDKENDKYIDNVVVSVDYSYPEIKTDVKINQDSAYVYEAETELDIITLNANQWYMDADVTMPNQPGLDESNTVGDMYIEGMPSLGFNDKRMVIYKGSRYRVYLLPVSIMFPRSQDNNKKYIYSIDLGYETTNDENTPYTTYSSYGKKTTGTFNVTFNATDAVTQTVVPAVFNIHADHLTSDMFSFSKLYDFSGETTVEYTSETIPDEVTDAYEAVSNEQIYGPIVQTIPDENFVTCLSNINSQTVHWFIDAEDNIRLSGLRIPVSYIRYYPPDQLASFSQTDSAVSGTYPTFSAVFPYNKELFEAESFTVSIRGNYKEVVEEDISGALSSNEDGDITHSYSGNSMSSYKKTINGDVLPVHTVKTIIADWQNGKETATIRVSVNDYYDTDGNIALSITDESKPMLFKNGDIVIPYVATPGGDRPMSVHPDGTAKSFLVTGVTLISDGAVWQELQLQEVGG